MSAWDNVPPRRRRKIVDEIHKRANAIAASITSPMPASDKEAQFNYRASISQAIADIAAALGHLEGDQ